MQRLLISIKDAKDVDGVSGFVDGEGDQEGKPLHGFTADIPISNGRAGGQLGDAIKILGDQVGKAVAQIGSDGVVIFDGYCNVFGGSRGDKNRVRHQGFLKRCLISSHLCK